MGTAGCTISATVFNDSHITAYSWYTYSKVDDIGAIKRDIRKP